MCNFLHASNLWRMCWHLRMRSHASCMCVCVCVCLCVCICVCVRVSELEYFQKMMSSVSNLSKVLLHKIHSGMGVTVGWGCWQNLKKEEQVL